MNNKKIESMKIGGKILGEVIDELIKMTKPGVSELDLEKRATEIILAKGAKPSFKMVPGYNHTLCIATNEVIVHGIPTERIFKDSDIVGIDCGVYYNGFHTDMSETLRVSSQSSKLKTQNDAIDRFLEIGKRALNEAIKQARAGNRVGNISKAIQDIIEGAGYSVVRNLVGHGVGKNLHEKPEIPGFLSGKIENTPVLKSGVTLAIEVIYNMGSSETAYKNDNWTIVTADKKLSGLFERTILVTKKDPIVLTELVTNIV